MNETIASSKSAQAKDSLHSKNWPGLSLIGHMKVGSETKKGMRKDTKEVPKRHIIEVITIIRWYVPESPTVSIIWVIRMYLLHAEVAEYKEITCFDVYVHFF